MAAVNAKQIRRALDEFIKAEGRMPTLKETRAILRGEPYKTKAVK